MTQKIVLRILYRFYKQLKAIVIVIVVGKIKCRPNCNFIVIVINVIDPICLLHCDQ